jgi:hypothetical protein
MQGAGSRQFALLQAKVRCQFVFQLPGRRTGECDGSDAYGWDLQVANKELDPLRQFGGLSRTGSRQHQRWPSNVRNRIPV